MEIVDKYVNAEQIQQLINVLPNIFIYIVPGFIFIQIYNYVLNLKGKEIKNYILEYIMTSFIINSISQTLLSTINYFWKTTYALTHNIVQVVICLLSLISAYIIARIMKSEKWTEIMMKVKINRNNSSNIISDLIDYEYGAWVRVYLNNEKIIYDGALIKFDYRESYNDSFIVLEKYITYKYAKNELYNSLFNKEEHSNEHVAIKVSEINRIEVTYHENSKKIIKCQN